MLTENDFNTLRVFASVAAPGSHLYGSATVANKECETIGTLPINSAEEASCDYFISGESICGYSFHCISEIQLTLGNSHLHIKNKALHD